MATKPVKLTTRRIQQAKPDPDGKWRRIGDLLCQGLKLVITPESVKRWVWRYSRLDGTGPTEMGLGIWPIISLDEARRQANHLRGLLMHGVDPQELKERNVLEGMKLRKVAEDWLEKRKSLKSESWLQDKRNLLFKHCEPLMNKLPIRISPEMIDNVLAPLRKDTQGQAERARTTLVQLFNNAKARHIIPYGMQNPADREIQEHLSPPEPRNGGHWSALPYQQVPAFIQDLRTHQVRSVGAVALEFLILTAARSKEVLGAQWDEIEGDVWTIPAWRRKTRRTKNPGPLRVPLSEQALAVINLRERVCTGSPFVFLGLTGEQLDDKAMRSLLKDMGFGGKATVHGFRSSFRDWCEERHSFDWAAKEMCLGHKVGTEVSQAYMRSDLLEKRKEIMSAWGAFCESS